jgi:hypothetical protein
MGTEQLVGTIEKVKTHETDPTTPPDPDPWEAVSSEFSTLGDRLKETYRRVTAEGGPSEDEIKGAFATLVGAWDQVAASFSAALNDPDTRAHLKKAAGSFAAALGATMTDLGDEIGRGSSPSGQSGKEGVDEGGAGVGVVEDAGEPPPSDEGEL